MEQSSTSGKNTTTVNIQTENGFRWLLQNVMGANSPDTLSQ